VVLSHKFLGDNSMFFRHNIFLSLLIFCFSSSIYPQTAIAPPTELIVKDTPDDAGGSIDIFWKKSIDDGGGSNSVTGYEIFRSTDAETGFEKIGEEAAGSEH